MKLRKGFLAHGIVLTIILLILTPGFSQVNKGGTISFTGIIENISKGYKSIVVDSRNISISSDTKIFDEKGNILRIGDLKADLFVTVEALKSLDGFLAKKIVVKKPRGE